MAASEDDIGDDGGSTIVTVELPGWVRDLRPLASFVDVLVTFARNPFRFVASVISVYLLDGIFGIFGVVVGAIFTAFDYLVAALAFVRGFLVGAFGAVGIDILGVLVELQVSIAGVVATAGPAGPVIAVGVAAVGIYAMYRLVAFIAALVNPT